MNFQWLKNLFRRAETNTPRAASIKCVCCEGWTHQFNRTEIEASRYEHKDDTELAHFTCGRCNAVSEWYTGAPIAIFVGMLTYGTTLAQLRLQAEDMQAEYNLLLLKIPEIKNTPAAQWATFDDMTYHDLLICTKMLRRNIDTLKAHLG